MYIKLKCSIVCKNYLQVEEKPDGEVDVTREGFKLKVAYVMH